MFFLPPFHQYQQNYDVNIWLFPTGIKSKLRVDFLPDSLHMLLSFLLLWVKKQGSSRSLSLVVLYFSLSKRKYLGIKLDFSTKWNLKLGGLNYAVKCFSYNFDSWNMCMQGDIWRRVKSCSGLFWPIFKKDAGKLNYFLRITHPHSASGTGSHIIFYPLEQKEPNFDPGLHHIRHFQVWSGWVGTIFLLWQFTGIMLIILRNSFLIPLNV